MSRFATLPIIVLIGLAMSATRLPTATAGEMMTFALAESLTNRLPTALQSNDSQSREGSWDNPHSDGRDPNACPIRDSSTTDHTTIDRVDWASSDDAWLASAPCDCRQQESLWQTQSCSDPKSEIWIGSLAWKKGPWQITPFGSLTGEFIASDAPTTARAFVLYIDEDLGTNERVFTVHGQTTSLGFDIKGPSVGTFQSGGMIQFNFLGDRPVLNQSTPFLLRAYGELKNEDWRFGFGVGPDIFGALTPETVNWGGQIQAGNIAAFRGQLRAEQFILIADYVRWTTMAAMTQQVVSDFVADPVVVGTDNGWPNLEGRMQLAVGESPLDKPVVQVGAAGVVGQTRAIGLAGRNVSATWGVSMDGQIDCGRFGARLEAFTGEAIGTYNAAIGQSLNPQDGEAITTVGGFGELWYKPLDRVAMHIGYGIDDPKDSDLGQFVDPMLGPVAGQRSRNSVCWTNLIWSVTEFFEVAFEVSYRETDYIAPSVSNDSMIYHFRSRLIF